MKDGTRLHMILADSEIEIVPKEYWSHPAVVNNARKRKKRPSQVLLDSSLHHSIFRDPEERGRRGRPDIVHQFLLLGLDSILNTEDRLSLMVHTRNDELIHISPETRLPKNYNRYSGLFEELFSMGAVPNNDNALIRLEKGVDLEEVVRRTMDNIGKEGRVAKVMIMDPSGDTKDLRRTIEEWMKNGISDLICIIGGFSNGKFKSDILKVRDLSVSLPGGNLKVWTVISEVLVTFRSL